jgi:hypothetical protein
MIFREMHRRQQATDSAIRRVHSADTERWMTERLTDALVRKALPPARGQTLVWDTELTVSAAA